MATMCEIASPDRLSPEMTLAEALQVAMEFEQMAYEFYNSLERQVRPEVRPLVRELAADEQDHYALLENLSRDSDLVHHLSHRISKSASTEAIGEYVNLPMLDDDEPAEDSLLECAQSRERIAFEYYTYLSELTPAGPLRDLFEFLRDEEKKHEEAIQTRWATLFSIF